MVHVTRDRKVHVAERTWKDMRRTTETQTKDLLQFREIIDFCENWTHLRYVEWNLEEQGFKRRVATDHVELRRRVECEGQAW